MALIIMQGMLVENIEIDVSLKNKDVDHEHFDLRYQMNKKRNQAKLVDELKNLRESRQELREFEKNIDKDLVRCHGKTHEIYSRALKRSRISGPWLGRSSMTRAGRS